uniref:Uncharacterized protein n=1 Tax=Terrapene triunguis TaxID=2587831 RepID=A0A674JZ90_9SAUR
MRSALANSRSRCRVHIVSRGFHNVSAVSILLHPLSFFIQEDPFLNQLLETKQDNGQPPELYSCKHSNACGSCISPQCFCLCPEPH